MTLFQEFKKFAMKGNVVDMAVGIIIGAAFGAIVTSLVNDIIMPPIGKLIGDVNFVDLQYSLGERVVYNEVVTEEGEIVTEPVVKEAFINYGRFIQKIIDFLIVAVAVFLLVKAVNEAQERFDAEQEPVPPPPPPEEVALLTEIRDLLRQRSQPAE